MKYIKPSLSDINSSCNIAIVVSLFNAEITKELLNGTINRLLELGVDENNITVVEVPGAIEIPIVLQRLLKKHQYDVAIALGAVIRGETTHYDYVCQQVSSGVQKISLDLDVPIVFGVLTTENVAQALDRIGGVHGHKGVDAADCALSMLDILVKI